MFILEQAITKQYWAPRYKAIMRLYKKGHWREVGLGVIEVFNPLYYNFKYYVIMTDGEKPRPMGWMEIWRKEGWKAWDESQVWLFPAFRGKGLSKLLYRAIISIDGQILYSGASHTKYTRAMWESFIRKGTYQIHAHDIVNLRQYCDVAWNPDDGQLWSALPLYEDWANRKARKIKRDIRLVAVKKGTS